MKLFLLCLTVFCATANAQVNLDKPYAGKSGNTLFYDLTDANIVWAIPSTLEATSDLDILNIGNEYRVKYTVGLPQSTVTDLAAEPNSTLSFKAFRATETTLDQFIDIDAKFKPVITPLGDIAKFGEPVMYNLSVSRKSYPNGAKSALMHLFDGKHTYTLGNIKYYFSASRSGQLFQAQSTIGILTGKKKQPRTNMFADDYELKVFDTEKVFNPEIQMNSQTGCWGKAIENIICLKD
jgi:hypothetical protein